MRQMYNISDYEIKLDKLGKIIIYLRKSREDLIDGRYASDEETLSRHEEQLQQWALQRLGYKIPPEHIYKEVESGEKIKNRPIFQEVLRQIESPDVGGVLVLNCSRLSRGDLGDCDTIIKTFEITNTTVLTPPKNYNLKDKYDKRFFKDELLRGNDYLEQTKELLANGRHWSTSIGKYTASKPPFGYDKVTCAEMDVADGRGFTLRPNSDAKYVKMVFDLYLSGMGVYKIASHMKTIGAPLVKEKEWDHCIVKRLLKLETYSGFLTWGMYAEKEEIIDGEIIEKRKINPDCPVYKGLHDAIISKEDFDRVQALRKQKTPPLKHGTELRNPLVGLIRCGVCDKAMVLRSISKQTMKRRKYPLDKAALHSFINQHRKAAGLTGVETARRLGLAKHYAQDWFGSKSTKFFPAEKFIEKWELIKKVLHIISDEYDDAITVFVDAPIGASLSCSGHCCTNRGALIGVIENNLLHQIRARFDDYNYFLDNYAEEVVKQADNNRDIIVSLEKQISMKNTQLKNARLAFEKGVDTLDEYIERKKELATEKEELQARISKLKETSEEEKTIKIKKAVPILKNVFANYFDLSAAEKNELLKTIIDNVSYLNETGENGGCNMTLDVCWLV